MKTTIEIDDELLRRVKQQAGAGGMTLRTFVEEALRARLLPRPRGRDRFQLDLPVVEGTAPPAVDISDRNALYDLMERD
jgi:Arc/MetJ family transcription regulator